MPGIFEGSNLRFGLLPLWAVEEDVVILVAVEGWIQVDQVDRFAGDMLPQDDQVVTEVKLVHGHLSRCNGVIVS